MDLTAHGGDIYTLAQQLGVKPEEILDVSANVTPFGTPAQVVKAMQEAASQCAPYPDPASRELCQAIGQREGVPAQWVLCGSGASDCILRLMLAIRPQKALVLAPTFSEYEKALALVGAKTSYLPLWEEDNFGVTPSTFSVPLDGVELVALCSPNNPTGQAIPREILLPFLRRCRDQGITVLLDACFSDFMTHPQEAEVTDCLESFPNLVILKAFTKMYGMAGVRLGYCLCSDANLLERMSQMGQHWPVSTLAQAAGLAALSLEGYAQRTAEFIAGERDFLRLGLAGMGLKVYPSQVNYLLFFSKELDLAKRLRPYGILLRDCSNYPGLGAGFYRTAVKTRPESERLLCALAEVLG